MKNNGKQLEGVVRLVEESYKNSTSTQIFSNYKIPNVSGQAREIDVLIISKINGFDIYIAIECKDYIGKIGVDKIEAFHGKCLRLPMINKKIFVSKGGYQKDALLAAESFGIELMTAETLTSEYISQLIPIRQIKPIFHYQVDNVVMSFAANEDRLKIINKDYTGEVFRGDKVIPESILEVFADAMQKHPREIFGLALIEYFKMKNTHSKDMVTLWPPFGLKFEGYYIKHLGERIDLLDAQFNVRVDFKFVIPKKISGRSIKHLDGSVKADSFDIQIKDGLESHMIIKSDSEADFFVTENEQTRKLQTLFAFDPKTGKITKPKK
jgi:hypothetical protein